MDFATAQRCLWSGVAVLTVELVAVAQAIEMHQSHWWSPCRTIAGVTLLAVAAALFVVVHLLSRR
jgi:hypothetical protein